MSPSSGQNLNGQTSFSKQSPRPAITRFCEDHSATKKEERELDSSDDEAAAPALSAAAEELLSGRRNEKDILTQIESNKRTSLTRLKPSRVYNGQLSPSPDALQHAFFYTGSPRVVKIKRMSPATNKLRRTDRDEFHSDSIPSVLPNPNFKTPVSRLKDAVDTPGIPSSTSVVSSENPSSRNYKTPSEPISDEALRTDTAWEDGTREQQNVAHATNQKSKGEENCPQNSLRVKRVGKVQGRFLSGPARRGVPRRQSEEEHSPIRDQGNDLLQHSLLPTDRHQRYYGMTASFKERVPLDTPKRSPDAASHASGKHHIAVIDSSSIQAARAEALVSIRKQENEGSHDPLVIGPMAHTFRVPPMLPSIRDQENEPPPTFRRNKQIASVHAEPDVSHVAAEANNKNFASPASRKALAARSQNTPRRPAPPPPKMSMLETATATAGAASATQRRLKRQYISINGKMFTKMECIGRGGSGRVYRVMAENFKHFALKRVSLEDVDQAAIRGFKGEIDLLRKLENVDRVIRLYDYEVNEEKKTLSVLMDLGELDLKKILDPRLDEETGAFDVTFTRYIWKEMLECVQAIHAHDIVHSDLKPANFVSAQGRLKLIDFGIANAIQDDTVNVHREQQIGTPNYMAPEALLDVNSVIGRKSSLGKLMKLGKPSDVWSLACILYQIVYGKPPFGHLSNQMNKVMAITDPTHTIAFPELGVGKSHIPSSLVRTMKRCLNRDPAIRPTISELLSGGDPFLHPDGPGCVSINEEQLKLIQRNVLKIIETHGLPKSDARSKEVVVGQWLNQWGSQLFAGIKHSIEKRSV